VRVLRAADEHPVATLMATTVVLYLGLRSWGHFAHDPVLLARADSKDRVTLYGQFASSAVALLAVSLTVLAILVALPDRPTVADLRRGSSWPRIQAFLLSTALLCIVSLVCAHVGAAIDNGMNGREWLELLLLTTATMSVVSVLTGGLAFGLFLRRANELSDPSEGRGTGPAE
jgi:hypothetical protein